MISIQSSDLAKVFEEKRLIAFKKSFIRVLFIGCAKRGLIYGRAGQAKNHFVQPDVGGKDKRFVLNE